jgi:hypothetical protein
MDDKYVGPEKYLYIFHTEKVPCSECSQSRPVEVRLTKCLVTFLEVVKNEESNSFTFNASLHGHKILDSTFINNNLRWYLE